MTNETTIKVPKKHQHMVESITFNPDWHGKYKIVCAAGYAVDVAGHKIHSHVCITMEDVLFWIRGIVPVEPEAAPTSDTSATIEVSKSTK